MTSFVSVSCAIMAVFLLVDAAPQQPPQAEAGIGAKMGDFADRVAQQAYGTAEMFIPKGIAGFQGGPPPAGGPPGGPPPAGAPPAGAPPPPQAGSLVAVGERKGHGFADHLHNAACRNATTG